MKTDEIDSYGQAIVGKTFEVIQAPSLVAGDVVIQLSVDNVGYEVPKTVRRVVKVSENFFDVEFVGAGHKRLPRYARTYCFGRLK